MTTTTIMATTTMMTTTTKTKCNLKRLRVLSYATCVLKIEKLGILLIYGTVDGASAALQLWKQFAVK